MHIADLLNTRANLTPNRIALIELTGDRHYTYADLNTRANRAAHFLAAQGVGKGDRVCLLAHNSVVYVDLLFACAKLGAIFAPLNWRLTAHELNYIVGDCEPTVFLCGPEFIETLEALRPTLGQTRFVSLEGATISNALRYEDEVDLAPTAEPVRPALDGDDPLCLLYTSGTTGRPKGALIPHRQVLWNCINTVISWGLSESDVSPIFTPMFHAGGLFVFLTPLLYAGGRLILTRAFDPEGSLRTIESYRCTAILGVPTLFQKWLDTPYFAQTNLSHVRFFINGGAPMALPLVRAWRAATPAALRQGYGLTEVGTNCFSMTDEEALAKTGSVGKPIFHSQMRLIDPETNEEAPIGQPGELRISGPHVCSGYWHNPQATTEAIQNGWFHTGDMARRDEDGFFYIVGRYKDMIKSGGENIYAAEVEQIFRNHPAVADAALIGQPDAHWGEVGVMVVVLKPGGVISEEALLAFCQHKLARFKIPKLIIFADSLPYSPYGKVEKAKLRAQYIHS
jgi:fatty-acyl-CoA synthase